MKKYKEYFKYILEHKKNVFIECWKEGLYIHAFTHDLSKFSPKEFKAYAEYFYGEWGVKTEKQYSDKEVYTNGLSCLSRSYLKCKSDFDDAWEHHYKNNKHHWNYWIGQDMPEKYIKQMMCDWKGMSRKFGDTAQEFYLKNYKRMNLSWNTRMYIEMSMDLNFSEAHGYGHTMEQFAEMYDKETYDNYFGWIREKYGIDTYEILRK